MGTTSALVRRLITVAVAAFALAIPRAAGAALMHSYDIASLAYEAQEIVLVEKVKGWRLEDQLRDFETVRVRRSYAGSALRAGDEITIETSCYGFEPMFGWNREGRPKPVVSEERILFLSPLRKDAWSNPPDAGAPPMAWGLGASGMRIFVDGRVYRFAQEMNPGCYGPIPGEGPRHAPYTRADFEKALAGAIATAKEAHALLDAPGSPQRTDKLIALVGPPTDAPYAVRSASSWRDRDFGLDRIASQVLEMLAKEGNIQAVLEAESRTSRVDLFMSRVDVAPERFVEAARSALPVRQRVAALAFLTYGSLMFGQKPDLGALFTALLSDPAPEIRLAALNAPFSQSQTPKAYLNAIVDQFRDEKDARVRYALFSRAKREGIVDRLAIPARDLPLARAMQHDGNVSAEWGLIDGNAGWPESVAVELRKAGKLVSREIVEPDSRSSSGTDSSIYLADLTVPPGVTPGTYDVRIDLTIAQDKRSSIRRSLDVGAMDLGPRPRARLAEAEAPSPAPTEEPLAPAAAAVVPSPMMARGLAIAERPEPRIFSGALIALFLGVLVVRQRRVRRRPGT